ncbi:S41 family peptidase [Arthrobacter parietis]|uniref:S41 family peptidase n=2 Tax=Arthrobacter TaxID=1663 RepID=A0ABT6CWD0_9MICC|nr:S41 family peptidase [Arthrobacter vasquezii]MDF9277875.1 S41 family peptidase [Arthrobacter vasquezii]
MSLRRAVRSTAAYLFALALMTGCASSASPGTPEAESSNAPDENVRKYVSQALTFIEENSYKVATDESLDWKQLKAGAIEDTANAQTVEGTHAVIDDVLLEASGDHSFFLTPEDLAETGTEDPVHPSGSVLGDGVVSLEIPAFNETAGGLATRYADAAVDAINANQGEATCGWIVDLRDNTGGNMWPMIASLTPFLPDGPVMSFVDGVGERSVVSVEADSVFSGEEHVTSTTGSAPELADLPLAVLQSGDTASSGEATLISLLSREGVRTFGSPSAGYATGNVSSRLPDGSIIGVTQSRMATADGTGYTGAIEPDVATDDPEQTAVAWLNSVC